MDARSIKPADANRIGKALQPGPECLRRLRGRMVEVGFLPDDPLFAAVLKAQDGAGELLQCKTLTVSAAAAAPCSGAGAIVAPGQDERENLSRESIVFL